MDKNKKMSSSVRDLVLFSLADILYFALLETKNSSMRLHPAFESTSVARPNIQVLPWRTYYGISVHAEKCSSVAKERGFVVAAENINSTSRWGRTAYRVYHEEHFSPT